MKCVPMSVEYCYHSGNDLEVVNAARVSFAKKSEYENLTPGLGWHPVLVEKDVKLINYLAKHKHWTPFAHNSITLRIKAPLFIARQAGKHQVGLVWNEVSRRYVDDEPEFYFPEVWRGKPTNVKQGSEGVVDITEVGVEFTDGYSVMGVSDIVNYSLQMYEALLEKGVAPEQARMVLPQNTMTEWIWTGSLAAFMRVINLRLDPHAQKEIQELTAMTAEIIEPLFPVSFKALLEVEQEVNIIKKEYKIQW
jgi:thymidylate synthase (FAD)